MNKLVLAALAAAAALSAISCGNSGNTAGGSDSDSIVIADTLAEPADTVKAADTDTIDHEADIALIRQLYDKCVFTGFYKEPDEKWAEKHLSKSMLKKLRARYADEYDGMEPGYAFWELRTGQQDSVAPAKIYYIKHIGDNWYEVSYSDWGVEDGTTKILVTDNKIADYKSVK